VSRYDAPAGEESEFEPGSSNRVLRNSQGITDQVAAEQVETELLTVAYVDSFDLPISVQFSIETIRKMHRNWLGGFYPTAGEYRTVNVSKGGFMFCPASNIESEMQRFEREQLAELTPCSGLLSEVAFKASVVHAELLLIHPFREGNGRLGRWLADLMVLQAGYPAPDYDLEDEAKRNTYYAAMRRAYAGDLRPLTSLFLAWIERAQQLPAGLRTTQL